LGSAGTIRNNFDFVCKDKEFLICYADNLTNMNLAQMIDFHRLNHPVLTLGLFYTNNPSKCGIAEIDENNTIISFIEKPENPTSNLAGAGVYIASHEIKNYLPDHYPSDIGYEVLPQLAGLMKGYLITDYFIDIGTVENYERACRELPKKFSKNQKRRDVTEVNL